MTAAAQRKAAKPKPGKARSPDIQRVLAERDFLRYERERLRRENVAMRRLIVTLFHPAIDKTGVPF